MLTLPDSIVSILRFKRREGQRLSLEVCLVTYFEFLKQYPDRPAIGYDVMHANGQDMFMLVKRNQRSPDQLILSQIKRGLYQFVEEQCQSICIICQVRPLHNLQRPSGIFPDLLVCMSFIFPNDGSKYLVAL